jgi:hypothetical protein
LLSFIEDTVLVSENAKPAQYIDGIDRLSTELNLPSGDYTDFTPLLEFKNLEVLKIDNPWLSNIDGISVLVGLPKLRSLIIWSEKITTIRPISTLTNLHVFSFSVGYYPDASELLYSIDLKNYHFRQHLQKLSKIPVNLPI